MAYSIGLDCGISSVGYAILELDSKEEPKRIIRLGSRIFDKAENPKDGSSLAKPRREARSARRRLRRHRFRLERVKSLIVEAGVLTKQELETLFEGRLPDIYALRVEALDRALLPAEFARVLIHLAQRRGFKSNRKTDASAKEEGELLGAVSKNEALMREKGYRTAGEMFARDALFSVCKRNKSENYLNTVSRSMVEDEIKLIFDAQRRAGNPHASQAMQARYLDIVLSQRSFEEGPGGNSPYGGNQIERMLGACTFFPDEKRAVKASYSFQYFTLLQNINNLRIVCAGETRTLTADERGAVKAAAFASAELSYDKLRKALGLADDEYFAALRYGKGDIAETEKAAKFNYLKAYHEIRKALKREKLDIGLLTKEQLNAVGYAFTVYKNDEKIGETLKQAGIGGRVLEALMKLPSFAKAGHISVKACEAIIPWLEQGLKYDQACEAAGFDFKAHIAGKKSFLPADEKEAPELGAITNPVVRRAVSQTVKVVNAILREMGGPPVYINIELSREMSKTFDERRQDESRMKENMAFNERIKQEIKDHFGKTNPTGMDIVKLKLWKEQDGRCPYSLESIDYTRLFEDGYVDIDHIIPYSVSFDDSYKNKVLVMSAENRQKGNRLPLQYLQGKRRDDFVVWVGAHIRDARKRQMLLKEKLTEEDEAGFKQRNLQDTQYLSRFLLNFIWDHLDFAVSVTGKKKRVTAVNGAVTGYMRKRWGIQKIRENGDLHHAVDAVVVGCVTDGVIRKVSEYAKRREQYADAGGHIVDRRTGEVKDVFPPPWPDFRTEVEIRLMKDPARMLKEKPLANYAFVNPDGISPCFVSRMPQRKVTGAAHKDTVRSPKALGEGLIVSKKPLTDLRLDAAGEIAGYYMPGSDPLLYGALQARLKEYGLYAGSGSAKDLEKRAAAAFAGPFFKPKADGSPGPVVKKVKIAEKASLTVGVLGGRGAAVNDSMVRIDIFYVAGEGYYYVPVYVADTVKPVLPNKACVQAKPYEQWKVMREEDFLFSLYPNDLVRVTAKKPLKMGLVHPASTIPKEMAVNGALLYYTGAGISAASIMVINDDHTYVIHSLGVKTLVKLEKYQVDVLGNVSKVGREKRLGFAG